MTDCDDDVAGRDKHSMHSQTVEPQTCVAGVQERCIAQSVIGIPSHKAIVYKLA